MKGLIGIVVSTKMEKTAVVKVDRFAKHPLYKKAVKRSKRYLAHDEIGVKEGDKVKVAQTKPISKRKKWRVVEIVR